MVIEFRDFIHEAEERFMIELVRLIDRHNKDSKFTGKFILRIHPDDCPIKENVLEIGRATVKIERWAGWRRGCGMLESEM